MTPGLVVPHGLTGKEAIAALKGAEEDLTSIRCQIFLDLTRKERKR